ncbi:hypothetical protein IMZ48_45400 [Candidatus Bathyarchaeota archaeon]|nr:hypothetical protein [Candidatus Bathyarchaeota archaeon]
MPGPGFSGGAGCPNVEGTGSDLATLLAIRNRSMVLSSLERREPAESRWGLDDSDVVKAAAVGPTETRVLERWSSTRRRRP